MNNVLIIYSGGTIGMLESPEGKKTYPGFLFDNLSSQARFHDPQQNTIFSHSRDIQTFRQWRKSTSRETSRAPSPLPSSETHHAPDITQNPSFLTVNTHHGQIKLPSLHTPRSSGRAVQYCVYEYERLIDSSDVGFDDWIRMATDIEANYKLFDSFIILHGTDTMAYSASALAFMLEDLGKPVIVTGAQIPLSESRNDAIDNLLGALALAGSFMIPEVTLFFHHTLYRGCRSTKSSSSDFEAFSSPNMAPLARVGINIDVDWHAVLRPTALKALRVQKELCPHVASLRLFPGITTASVKAFLTSEIRGVVLSTYGAGNCPQRKDLLNAFSEASGRGVVIVNVTQCQKGAVEGSLYENGRKLEAAGVVSGVDMTIECALTKLAYLLAKDISAQEVRRLMSIPLRGELTPQTVLVSDLTDSVNGRISGMISRMLMITPVTNKSATAAMLGDTGSDYFTPEDLHAAENTIDPLLLSVAAARQDPSLRLMLGTLLADNYINQHHRSQGIALLNTFATLSPLHIACLHAILDNVRALVEAGASVHVRDVQGHTPLYYACSSPKGDLADKMAIIRVLKSAGGHLTTAETEQCRAEREKYNGDLLEALAVETVSS